MDAILVPGGFGDRGIEGKIQAIRYARENRIPYLGICLGMQLAIIEYARNVLALKGANSTEFDRATNHPVIALITEWQDLARGQQVRDEKSELGGTMRLGAQEARLISRLAGAFAVRQGLDLRASSPSLRIQQSLPRRAVRRRHALFGILRRRSWWSSSNCRIIPGSSRANSIRSSPRRPATVIPLFSGFIRAAREYRAALQPGRATA